MTDENEPRRRRGGRDRTRASGPRKIEQTPFAQPMRHFEPTRVVSDDELESIHLASLEVLRDIGIDVHESAAREIFRRAGADVKDGQTRVRFSPEMVTETIQTAPSEFTMHSWNPDRSIAIGGRNVAFTAVASPPNVSDLAGGRRSGNRKDFQNLVRLTQHLNAIHMNAGYPCLLYTSPSPRDRTRSRMPSSA